MAMSGTPAFPLRAPSATPRVLMLPSLAALHAAHQTDGFELMVLDVQAHTLDDLQREIAQAMRLWEGAHNINALLDMLLQASEEKPLILYLRGWAELARDPRFTWFILTWEDMALPNAPLFLVLEEPARLT